MCISLDDIESFYLFFPQGSAWAEQDSAAGQIQLLRYFYSGQGRDHLLVGVPVTWLQQHAQGDVIISPNTAVAASGNVWLEDANNKGSQQLLIAGKSGTYPKKRTIIKFDIAGSGIPTNANIINAQMQLYYYEAFRPTGDTNPWLDRWLQVHRLVVDWQELQATRDVRLTGVNWAEPYGAIDGRDAQAEFESTMLFQQGEAPRWKAWNLTNATQLWLQNSASNYGVIVWTTTEDSSAAEMRFRSSRYTTDPSQQPYLEVTWSQEIKTVYFLKDHLGSTRATVDENGKAVGYDDYDPWGYTMTGRTTDTDWTNSQNVGKNKFTGKDWVDDFGLNWYYFGARYYDPEIGRWPVVDPLSERYGALSPYSYGANNPLMYVDLDGQEIVLGSAWDRFLNTFGYKTANLRRIEGIASILRSTETGSALYNCLDARPEEIIVKLDSDIEGPSGMQDLGITEVTGIEANKATEVTIRIDPESANADQRNANLIGDQGAATTMAHELGHAEAAVTDLRQYTKEATPKGQKTAFGDKGTGTAEKIQAEPYENAVRIELLQKNKEKKNEQ